MKYYNTGQNFVAGLKPLSRGKRARYYTACGYILFPVVRKQGFPLLRRTRAVCTPADMTLISRCGSARRVYSVI